MLLKKYIFVPVSLLLVVTVVIFKKPREAFAAVDGALSATSTGSSTVQLVISELVQVNNMLDLSLDNGLGGNLYVPGAGDVSGSNQFCVHYNNATSVDLTLTSTNGAGGGYVMDDGGGNQVAYLVAVDEGDNGSFTAHLDGATVQYPGMADLQVNCAGGTFNAVRVTVTDTGTILGVPNGTYSDTLQFLIAPNP